MKILAKGMTKTKCQVEIDRLKGMEWQQVSEMVFDASFVGGRYVAVMYKPDPPGAKKSKFNNYMG